MRIRVPPLLFVLLASLACAGSGSPPAEDLAPWDQEEATALAVQLASAASDARTAARQQPGLVGSSEPRVVRYLDALRRFETATRQLATALQNGQGREETRPIAVRVRRLARDARQHGSGLPQTLRTVGAIAPAENLLRDLSRFYFPEAA